MADPLVVPPAIETAPAPEPAPPRRGFAADPLDRPLPLLSVEPRADTRRQAERALAVAKSAFLALAAVAVVMFVLASVIELH
jgi:hypothetical protein